MTLAVNSCIVTNFIYLNTTIKSSEYISRQLQHRLKYIWNTACMCSHQHTHVDRAAVTNTDWQGASFICLVLLGHTTERECSEPCVHTGILQSWVGLACCTCLHWSNVTYFVSLLLHIAQLPLLQTTLVLVYSPLHNCLAQFQFSSPPYCIFFKIGFVKSALKSSCSFGFRVISEVA